MQYPKLSNGWPAVFALTFLFVFQGCGTPKSTLDVASKENGKFPTQFKPAETTLLILQSSDYDSTTGAVMSRGNPNARNQSALEYFLRRGRDKQIEYTKAHYPYKFAFASAKNIDSTAFDKTKYRYAFVVSEVTTPGGDMKPNGQLTRGAYIIRWYLLDRLYNISYGPMGNGSSIFVKSYRGSLDELLNRIDKQKK